MVRGKSECIYRRVPPFCALGSPKNISSPTDGDWLGVGTGWGIYAKNIESKFKCKIIDIKIDAYPHAKNVIQLAKPSYINGKFISADRASPIYLRDKIIN